jgi:hypothetical protein
LPADGPFKRVWHDLSHPLTMHRRIVQHAVALAALPALGRIPERDRNGGAGQGARVVDGNRLHGWLAPGDAMGKATNTTFGFVPMVSSTPPLSDPRLAPVVQSCAGALGLAHRRLSSGAGHDAPDVAYRAPMAMHVVPKVGGICRSPRECSRAADSHPAASPNCRSNAAHYRHDIIDDHHG